MPYREPRDDNFSDEDFPSGDPRRCPFHPNEKTSSDDGMFDTVCGRCETEMEEGYSTDPSTWAPPPAPIPSDDDCPF